MHRFPILRTTSKKPQNITSKGCKRNLSVEKWRLDDGSQNLLSGQKRSLIPSWQYDIKVGNRRQALGISGALLQET